MNSTGLQGHDSLFPLTLYPNLLSILLRFPGADGLRLHGRSRHYLRSKYTMFLFSPFALLPVEVSRHSREPNLTYCSEEFQNDKLMTSEWRKLMSNTLLSCFLTATVKTPERKAFNSKMLQPRCSVAPAAASCGRAKWLPGVCRSE